MAFIKNAAVSIHFILKNPQTGELLAGETVSVERAIDNGVYSPAAGGVTDEGGGKYQFNATAADMNGDTIHFVMTSDNSTATDVLISTEVFSQADLSSLIALVQAAVDLVKDKTDNLPADPASEASATTNTAAINSNIDENETKIDGIQSDVTTLQGDVTAIKVDTDALPPDPASETNATANTNTISALIGALNDVSAADVQTRVNAALNDVQLEDYAAVGVNASLVQLLYSILAILSNPQYSGTSMIARKLDGITQAMQFTMDDGNNPTDQVRVAWGV